MKAKAEVEAMQLEPKNAEDAGYHQSWESRMEPIPQKGATRGHLEFGLVTTRTKNKFLVF